MELHVDAIEAVWITLNLVALAVTGASLRDAVESRRAALAQTEVARRIKATGDVRREVLRVLVQLLLLSIAVPAAFSDRPTPLNAVVLALVAVPFVLMVSSLADAWDRGRIAAVVRDVMDAERQDSLARIEAAIAVVDEKASAAYREANDVNQKIASLRREVTDPDRP